MAAAGLAAVVLAGTAGGGGRTGAVSFTNQIQPIFDQKCVSCHPSSYPYLDLRPGHSWGQLVGVPAATAPSYERVLRGRPDLSYLLIGPEDPSRTGLLTRAERRRIATWIRQGALRN